QAGAIGWQKERQPDVPASAASRQTAKPRRQRPCCPMSVVPHAAREPGVAGCTIPSAQLTPAAALAELFLVSGNPVAISSFGVSGAPAEWEDGDKEERNRRGGRMMTMRSGVGTTRLLFRPRSTSASA